MKVTGEERVMDETEMEKAQAAWREAKAEAQRLHEISRDARAAADSADSRVRAAANAIAKLTATLNRGEIVEYERRGKMRRVKIIQAVALFPDNPEWGTSYLAVNVLKDGSDGAPVKLYPHEVDRLRKVTP